MLGVARPAVKLGDFPTPPPGLEPRRGEAGAVLPPAVIRPAEGRREGGGRLRAGVAVPG
jgi:hypothetical protein